jgi:hypothetical protein
MRCIGNGVCPNRAAVRPDGEQHDRNEDDEERAQLSGAQAHHPAERLMTFKTSFPYSPNGPYWNEADDIPWSEDTTDDLKRSLASGETVEEAAVFLQYSPKTVRAKMKELGLEEKPCTRKRRPR